MRNSNAIAVIGVIALIGLGPPAPPASPSPPDSPVADAAQRGDIEAVRSLLKDGADVNAAQGDGMTALHWAAEHGNIELCDMLIYAGANVDAVTRIGDYTPLHLASAAGQDGPVSRLLNANATVNAVTSTGSVSSLHLGAASGNAEVVTLLLDHGAVIDAREGARGQTPLMFAAASNRVATLQTLLAHGADPAFTTAVIDVPARQRADRAAAQRRNKVLAAFKDEEDEKENTSARTPSPDEVQAAVLAARELEANATDKEVADSTDYEERQPEALSFADLVGKQGGLTALLHAVREGHRGATFALLDAGADINQVSAGDHTSPLVLAMINGHFDLALELVDRGADVNLASDAGTTPLYAVLNAHWAPKARYPQQQAYQQQQATYLEVMDVLLKAGADPNARLKKHLWYMSYTFDLLGVDTKGATPFWRAAYATDVEAMKMLVAYGADPNLATENVPRRRFGRSRDTTDYSGVPPVPVGGPAVYPIHAASGVGYGEGFAANSHRHVPDGWLPAVKYLVEELGAHVNARDHNGYTPVHHAAARGDTTLINYFVEQGADVTAVSRRGQTTVDMANGPVQRVQPFPHAIALLERLGAKNNHNCVSCD